VFREQFLADVRIRRLIEKKYRDAGISLIEIERAKKTSVMIHTSKPGVIIGKQGAQIEELRKLLEKTFGGSFEVNVQEIRNPDADAACIAESIQSQIERRMPYRRACKMAMERAMQAGLIGVKIGVSGRLNGAEIARTDSFKDGNVPLQTLRANIQMATRHARTSYGTIGVQVWVYKGLVFKKIREVKSAALTSLPDA
jgi:small subunit ribosomal protein S3